MCSRLWVSSGLGVCSRGTLQLGEWSVGWNKCMSMPVNLNIPRVLQQPETFLTLRTAYFNKSSSPVVERA